jgi:hypothetical protein
MSDLFYIAHNLSSKHRLEKSIDNASKLVCLFSIEFLSFI